MTHDTGSAKSVLPVAFAPIHKAALGVAIGLVTGLAMFAVTAFHVVLKPHEGLDLSLLGQFFYGYRVSWSGAFLGLCWGFLSGFVFGWFGAFVRNLAFALQVFRLRTKAERAQTADFLDHI